MIGAELSDEAVEVEDVSEVLEKMVKVEDIDVAVVIKIMV